MPTHDSMLTMIQYKPSSRWNGVLFDYLINLKRIFSANTANLVHTIHKELIELHKVLKGTQALSSNTRRLALSLLVQQTPASWHRAWEGPEKPQIYISALMHRALGVQQVCLKKWRYKSEIFQWHSRAQSSIGALLSQRLDLSELFRPRTFLDAFRQTTARYKGQVNDYNCRFADDSIVQWTIRS